VEVGGVISRLRHELGYSQEELAERLFVSKDLVSKWENGSRRPDYPMIERIAAVFGVTAESILEKDSFIFDELSECVPDGSKITESEFTKILNGFLKRLGRNEAEIFVRRYYLTESFASIAKLMGIRENQVRSRLSKTRKKLKRIMKELEK